MTDTTSISDNVMAVRDRISRAAMAAGRQSDEIRLVAVGKTQPPEVLVAAVEAGVCDLGENRVSELAAKMDQLARAPAMANAKWHFIGRLQTRKARALVGRGVLVHSVDRRGLVDALQRRALAAECVQQMLIQVNVGDDPAKGGCDVQEVDALVAYACDLPNLQVTGLMTMPPLPPDGTDQAAAARPWFARLREIRDRLVADWPQVSELSMGMSADLSAAVAEGATMVRVGTAVFGPRQSGPWLGSDPSERL